jgi:hypothetical protein
MSEMRNKLISEITSKHPASLLFKKDYSPRKVAIPYLDFVSFSGIKKKGWYQRCDWNLQIYHQNDTRLAELLVLLKELSKKSTNANKTGCSGKLICP